MLPPFVIVLLVLFVLGLVYYQALFKRAVTGAMSEMDKKLNEFEASLKYKLAEYSGFTTGHPYVWVDYDLSNLRKHLKNLCYPVDGYPMGVPDYLLKVDEHAKRIYFVPLKKTFDWHSLQHYEDYIEKYRGQ